MFDNNKLRAVGYTRVSTKEQAVDGYSLNAQREKIKQYCEMHNLELVNVYTDEGISGKDLDGRDGIKDLMNDAKENHFDVVIIWKLSRISRRLIDTLSIIEDLNKENISLQSISEKLDLSTSSGTFLVQLMASINELERNTLRENVVLGHKAKANDGEWNGGKVIGYDNVKGKHGKSKLVINEKEAAVIRYIYETYLNGHGYRYIANSLNHAGHKTKRGNKFSTIAVKDILLNPLYKGEIRYGKKATNIKNLKESPVVTKGIHEPIIDPKIWDKVHERWIMRSKQPSHNRLGSNVLTGLIKCKDCGGHMVVSNSYYRLKDGTRVKKSYYVCGAFKNKGATACKANGIEVSKAEEKIANRFEELIDSDKLLEHLVSQMQSRTVEDKAQLEDHKKFLTDKIVKCDDRIHDYKEKINEEPSLADVWELAIARLETEKEEYTSELLVTQGRIKTESSSIDTELVSKLINKLIGKMKSTKTNRELKELYLAFIQEIKMDKDKMALDIQLLFNETNISEYLIDRPDPDNSLGLPLLENKDATSKNLPSGRFFLRHPILIWV